MENSILDLPGFVILGHKDSDDTLNVYYVPGSHGSAWHHVIITANL